ncbi:unnamed protein product, partial [Rotaria magnacalcarata]
ISQLPRIQRRNDAPRRPRPTLPVPPSSTRTSNAAPSFLDTLLNSQERLHNLQNVRIHGPEQSSSSSIVITRGTEEYDPFAIDDDENDSEQLKSAKNQKQESIRINNG